MSQRLSPDVERAVGAFESGDPVLIHDAAEREGETDLVYPAAAVTPAAVVRLRNDAGGLVCVALAADVAEALDLPFLADAIDHPASDAAVAYDDRPSFSLTVNHRETYTGITDRDRSLTIRSLAEAAREARADRFDAADFAATFRAPGHVHLLRSAPTLADRQGHTEFAIALAASADRAPAAVVCEMLDDTTGEALSPAAARDYADRHDLVYVEGSALLDALA